MKKSVLIKIVALSLALVLSLCLSFVALAADSDEQSTANTSDRGKLSKELFTKLVDTEPNEKVDVYVYFEDESEEVLTTMQMQYPEFYNVYTSAKTSDSPYSADVNPEEVVQTASATSTNGVALQEAIEVKRDLYRSFYSEHNNAIISQYCDNNDVEFISSYAPMAIVSLTREEIGRMIVNPKVTWMDLFENYELSLSTIYNANLTSRAAYVRDTYANKGAGVKIGQIECAVTASTNDNYLYAANITQKEMPSCSYDTFDIQHATRVARIMVGSSGIAPSAALYSVGACYLEDYYTGIEWLISQGVNVINMSAGFKAYEYEDFCRFIDHLSVQHDVHFVAAAGNNSDGNHYLTVPGLAYNAITVGAFSDNGTAPANDSEINVKQADDTFADYSKYIEKVPSTSPCKPNLVASGNDFETSIWTGTSFAAPQVTGVIAQLCSYDSALKTKQSSMGAILAASCGRKLREEVVSGSEIEASTGYKGGKFTAGASVDRSGNQISDKEGAGKLDARWARSIVADGNYWSMSLDGSVSTYTKTVYISAYEGSLSRVAIFWLKRNIAANDAHTEFTEIKMPNWDLRIYGPNNELLGTSSTTRSNFEIVQFEAPYSGTYKIQLTRVGTYSETTHMAIALW